MEPGDKDAVLTRMHEMLEAVVRGMVITAALQGVLTGIGLVFAGVPYAAFLGVLSGCAALLPFGTFLVWLACAIYLFAIGSIGSGIFLVLWGTFVISLVDNFVRPIVIGGRAQISTLLLFFGMIGGLEAYGFLGLFVGPALIATVAAFIEIYRQEYGDSFSAARSLPPSREAP
jgi:predicted PurR-regulated permease PerM